MRFNIALVLIICIIINANAFILQHTERVKRSTDEQTFVDRFRSGVKKFASGVKDFTVKGVEEVKNIFSKDRSAGDYRLHQLDVRFGEDEEQNATVTAIVEENSIEENREIKREKRKVTENLAQQEMIEKSIEDHFEGQSSTTEGE